MASKGLWGEVELMTEPKAHRAPLSMTLALLCVFVLATASCSRRITENVGGVSIPIPAKMTKVADKKFEPLKGFEDGQVTYEGNVSPDDIFTFYQEVMAADGWQPTSRYTRDQNRIAYTKGKRVVLISYDRPANEKTVLTVMVGTDNPR